MCWIVCCPSGLLNDTGVSSEYKVIHTRNTSNQIAIKLLATELACFDIQIQSVRNYVVNVVPMARNCRFMF